jgi:hypothetical protein
MPQWIQKGIMEAFRNKDLEVYVIYAAIWDKLRRGKYDRSTLFK